MRRIVLDTNCLLQALPSRSPYHKIWTEILAGHVSLCVNTEILSEYEEIIAQKTNADIAHNVVEAIARLHTTEFLNVYYMIAGPEVRVLPSGLSYLNRRFASRGRLSLVTGTWMTESHFSGSFWFHMLLTNRMRRGPLTWNSCSLM